MQHRRAGAREAHDHERRRDLLALDLGVTREVLLEHVAHHQALDDARALGGAAGER